MYIHVNIILLLTICSQLYPPKNEWGGAMPVLTAKLISKLSCDDPQKPIFVWDDKLKGFAVCVTKTRKSFVFKGRIKQSGTSKQIKIAGCDVISVDEARERARVIAGEFFHLSHISMIYIRSKAYPFLLMHLISISMSI